MGAFTSNKAIFLLDQTKPRKRPSESNQHFFPDLLLKFLPSCCYEVHIYHYVFYEIALFMSPKSEIQNISRRWAFFMSFGVLDPFFTHQMHLVRAHLLEMFHKKPDFRDQQIW